MAKSTNADDKWLADDKTYPRKRGICSNCQQKDEIKLAFDQINWLCVNAHACMLRFGKLHAK